jgi:hypothetical protein
MVRYGCIKNDLKYIKTHIKELTGELRTTSLKCRQINTQHTRTTQADK